MPTGTADQGWSVLLPPGWTTLPTEPEAARAAIKRLIDRFFEGKPRDELVHVRIQLDTALRHQVDRAREAGAAYVHSLTEPIHGMPVSAIGVAVAVRTEDSLLDALTGVLGSAEGTVESGEVTVDGRLALRRVRRERERLGGGTEGEPVMTTSLDFVEPTAVEEILVLSLTTTNNLSSREVQGAPGRTLDLTRRSRQGSNR
jgi:hypothetical protein